MLDESITGKSSTSYSKGFIKNLMSELDTNGDGDIDFDEFISAFKGLQDQQAALKDEGACSFPFSLAFFSFYGVPTFFLCAAVHASSHA